MQDTQVVNIRRSDVIRLWINPLQCLTENVFIKKHEKLKEYKSPCEGKKSS